MESIVRDGTRDWPVPRTNFYIRIDRDIDRIAEALRNDLGDVPVAVEVLFGSLNR